MRFRLPPFPHPSSLRWILTLSLVGFFFLGIAIASVYFYIDTHTSRGQLNERTLQAQAQVLVDGLDQARSLRDAQIPADWANAYRQPGGDFAYTIYDARGNQVGKSSSLQEQTFLPLMRAPPGRSVFGSVIMLGPDATPTLTARVRSKNLFVVVRRRNMNDDAIAESISEEESEPLVLLIPFAVFATLAISAILRWALKPIRAASRQAEAIGPANLETRIESDNLPSEVRPLADAFNGVLDRLADAYEIERRITANAAHELRTPLTVLSLQLQRAHSGQGEVDWKALEEDVARMQRIVAQLLELARKEARAFESAELELLNFSRAVREAAAALFPLCEQMGRDLDVTLTDNLMLRGARAGDLRDLATNLIENAIVHGAGTITVTLDRWVADEVRHARLRVEDEGRDVRPEMRQKLFERFMKDSKSANSSGLGLAIVAQVAANFGGIARFIDRQPTTIEIVLPEAEIAEPYKLGRPS